MALHAIDDLSEALTTTRRFLFPFTWGRWLRLAFISLFVAGGSGGGSPPNSLQYTMEGPVLDGHGAPNLGPFFGQHLALIVGIVAVLLVLGLVLAWVAATLEFALLESLRSDAVHVREYLGAYSGLGLRLFAFRILFGLALVLSIGGLALAVVGPVLLGADQRVLFAFVLLVPVFLVIGLIGAVVYVFTTAFVVPIMVLEDRGVISAWKRFWTTLRSNWTQFLAFLVVGLFVMIAIGIAVGILAAIVGVIVAIPLAAVAYVFFASPGTVTLLPIALVGIPLAIVFFVAMAFVQVPVQVYLRYWALLVLGDVDEDLDLIPDQRAAVREPETT